MPYRFRKIDSREQEGRKAMGVLFPFNTDYLFTQTYTTLEMYKSNIMNYFLTAKKDRYLNPRFGCSLLNILFENYIEDRKTFIENQIKEDLQLYFPKLIVNSLSIFERDENAIQLSLNFSIKDTGLNDELTVEFR